MEIKSNLHATFIIDCIGFFKKILWEFCLAASPSDILKLMGG